jgi:hypothetical protein
MRMKRWSQLETMTRASVVTGAADLGGNKNHHRSQVKAIPSRSCASAIAELLWTRRPKKMTLVADACL